MQKTGKNKGFTLIEIAIVLVIISLLLGGVLKGQALIDSAKVKNLAGDFRQALAAVHTYQDKYKKLPGDDNKAVRRWSLAAGHEGNGDGTIGGQWNDTALSSESVLAWEHLRRADIVSGSGDFSSVAAASLPSNAQGGRFGISGQKPIPGLKSAAFYACSDAIDGKLALELDTQLDDGEPDKGALQAVAQSGNQTQADGQHAAATRYDENERYTLCMSY
jgi:prepilin-type N-terminal cleavage/methylation domain-containing protein